MGQGLKCQLDFFRVAFDVPFSSLPIFGICMLWQHIADFKVPYKTLASGIEFQVVDAIPKNRSGKLKDGSFVTRP